MRTALSITVGLTLALSAPSALAQGTGTGTTGTGTDTTTTAPAGTAGGGASVGGSFGASTTTAPAPTTNALPPAPPPPAPAPEPTYAPAPAVAATPATAEQTTAEEEISDHEKVIGHFAVGYLGLSTLPIATGGPGAAPGRGDVAAPVIGGRYWLDEMIGIDAGLGFALAGGSTETVNGATTTSTDAPGVFGLAIHGGVPLVFAHQKHYKFLLIPEVNVGFTSQTEKVPNPPPGTGDISRSGFHLDLGARIGSEIHFGFIGVPQLSLQATVGLYGRRDAWKVKQDVGNQTLSASAGQTAFGTSVQSSPWAIFVNNISAFYYFP